MKAGETYDVAAVLLAAGKSTRLAELGAKQLLDWHGKPMVRHLADLLSTVPFRQHLAVLGHRSGEVAQALGGSVFERVENPRFADGQSTSIRAAVPQIQASAALFVPCDQPFLTSGVVRSILDAHVSNRADVVVPRYPQGRGAPVLFARNLFEELAHLEGDQGGRQLLKRYADRVVEVPIDDPRAGLDVDRPEDYRRFLGWLD